MEKIVLFIPHLGPGGAQQVFIHLANHFAALGMETTVLVQKKGGVKESLLAPAVRYKTLGAGRMLTALFRLMRYLRTEKPPVVLSTLDYASVTLLLARWLVRSQTRIAVRIPIHISSNVRYNPQFNVKLAAFLTPWLFPKADAIIAVSKDIVKDLKSRAEIDVNRVHVIYNPALQKLAPVVKPATPPHPWMDGKNRIILAAGRFWEQKNYLLLIEAFASASFPSNIKLIIIGDGPQRSAMENRIKALGLEERVALPGFQMNPEDFMVCAEMFVLSSNFEGMPNALIQAMAAGCKLVATDCPTGPAEVLDGGRFGLLVPVSNPSALKEALIASLNAPRVPVPDSWLEQFTIPVATGKYRQVLESLSK